MNGINTVTTTKTARYAALSERNSKWIFVAFCQKTRISRIQTLNIASVVAFDVKHRSMWNIVSAALRVQQCFYTNLKISYKKKVKALLIESSFT